MDKTAETAQMAKVVKAYCLKPNQITATELLDFLRNMWGDKFNKLGASTQKLSPDVSSLIDHTRLREIAHGKQYAMIGLIDAALQMGKSR